MKNIVGILTAVGGSIITYAFGGWSSLLDVLVLFVAVDYATGVLASATEGKLSSKVGLIGIAKKLFIFLMAAIGHKIDTVTGNGDLVRDAVIWFYLANELISIIENGGRLGAPIPPVISQAVEVLKGKGGAQDDADKDSK